MALAWVAVSSCVSVRLATAYGDQFGHRVARQPLDAFWCRR